VINELNHVTDAGARKRRSPGSIVFSLLVFVLVVVLGVYETIPVKRHKATAPPPDPTAQAIHDLQAALQQAVDQLRGLQQTISSDHAETKRLSDQVNALSGKLEALQQSISRLLQFSQQSPQGRSATAR
jgi:septal ring factor EnvC (AmiA/AmiB activator)